MPERKLEPVVHAQQDVAVTSNQLRLRMRSLVGPMSAQIEQAADQIIAGTADKTVKRAALLWKIEAVPALRKALFEPDPYSAVMDTWVLYLPDGGLLRTRLRERGTGQIGRHRGGGLSAFGGRIHSDRELHDDFW